MPTPKGDKRRKIGEEEEEEEEDIGIDEGEEEEQEEESDVPLSGKPPKKTTPRGLELDHVIARYAYNTSKGPLCFFWLNALRLRVAHRVQAARRGRVRQVSGIPCVDGGLRRPFAGSPLSPGRRYAALLHPSLSLAL
jgi:hypothetical protein